jgi:outer membrane protein assembly factor BamD (BamD/ComL family)
MATTTVEPTTSQTVNAAGNSPGGAARGKKGPNRGLIAAGAGVVAVALGAYVAVTSGSRKETFAQRQLQQARAVAETGNLAQASGEFQKITQTYKGTEAAAEAQIALNQARLVNAQTELAVVGLREFLATKPDAKFAAPAQGLLGTALENAKKPAEAAEAYRQAAALATVDYLKAEYLMSAGRAYRAARKPEEAARIYREIITKYSETPSLTEAQVRLAEITKGQLPEVPTPKPTLD